MLGNRGTRTRSELCCTHPSADQESSPRSIDHKPDSQHTAPPRGAVLDVNEVTFLGTGCSPPYKLAGLGRAESSPVIATVHTESGPWQSPGGLAIWYISRSQKASLCRFLWSPYGIGQTIIFSSCGFFFLLLFFFFPRLISAAADWMSAILPHMVWP